MSFLEVIEEFVGSKKIGIFMIHLDRATERLPLIADLERTFNMKLNIFSACEGIDLVKNGHPTRCINDHNFNRTPGDVGCTVSHINICKQAIENNYDFIVIFEDDCITDNTLNIIQQKLKEFKALDKKWDLFLLGGDITRGHGSPFVKAYKFDRTHACILNRKFMGELISLYETYYNNQTTWAIDGIYSNVLQSEKCIGYGFELQCQLFYQNQKVPSYIQIRN